MADTEPMRILQECIDVLRKKGNDYQNPNSRVKQAHYYEHGLTTLMDIIQAKRLRLVSLIETIEARPNSQPNFESIEDSFKDMANYCAIAAAWCRGKIDGQDPDRDLLNRQKPAQGQTQGQTIPVGYVDDGNGAWKFVGSPDVYDPVILKSIKDGMVALGPGQPADEPPSSGHAIQDYEVSQGFWENK